MLILLREARRLSRRWGMYAQRTAFSAACFAFVLGLLWVRRDADPSSFGQLGRTLAWAYGGLQLMVVTIAAPSLIAAALIEEREEGTLDLLALTGLRPGSVLWGRIGSRAAALAAVVAAGLPVLALIGTLGGVAPIQAASATVGALTAGIGLGLFGGAIAVSSRTVAMPVVLTAGLAFFLGFVWPIYASDAIRDAGTALPVGASGGDAWIMALSPVISFAGEHWTALLPAAVWAPAGLRAAWVGAALFRRRALHGWDDTGHPWRGRGAWTVAFAVPVVIGAVFGIGAGGSWQADLAVASAFGLGAIELCLFAGTVILPRLERGYAWRPAWLRVVRFDPIVWREGVTGGNGAASRVVLVLGTLWAAALGILVAQSSGPDVGCVAVMSAFLATSLGSSLLLTASAVGERRSGTIELLVLSGMSPARIVGGKLVAAAIRTLPLLAIAMVFGVCWEPDRAFHGYNEWYGDLQQGALPGLKLAFAATWVLAAWACGAIGTLLLALWLRPSGVAWAVAGAGMPAWNLGWVMAAITLREMFRTSELARGLSMLMMPWFEEGWQRADPTPEVIASTVGLVLLAAALFGVTVKAFPRLARRGL